MRNKSKKKTRKKKGAGKNLSKPKQIKQMKQTNELENKPIFQIPLPPKPTEKKFDFQPQIDVNDVNKLSTINESTNVTKTETDNVEDSVNEEENVGDVQEIEHLAIYSNDN